MNLLDGLNSKYNLQATVQVKRDNVSAVTNPTAPTRIDSHGLGDDISSAASNSLKNSTVLPTEALKAQSLAQKPVSYTFIRDVHLPFSNKAKLFKLATGQQVLVLEKKGPTVLETYYNVGSMNELDEQRGISHFNEHMAFNGSNMFGNKTLGAGDFFKHVNNMGAITNASTGFSQTNYFVSSQLLGDKVFDKSVYIQAQQLLYPEHTNEMVEKEKGPVTSEISMVGDQPENKAINNCIKNLFQIESTSPDLVAGRIDNINNLDRQKTLDYYNLWYTPDNCSTVVTGEVPTQEVIDTIARNFNKSVAVDVSKRKYQEFRPISVPVRVDERMPKAQSSIVALGFAGPKNISTRENVVLEVLMTALLGYKTARISKELNKIQTSAMMSVERVGNKPDDPKAILVASQMTPEKTEDVLKIIYKEIGRVSQEPLSLDELETAKKSLKIAFSKISENSQMLNNLLGNCLLDNNLEYVENFLSILDSVSSQDVSNFAKKYLDLNKASLAVVHPEKYDEKLILSNYQKTQNSDLAKTSFKKRISFGSSSNVQNKNFDLTNVKQYKLANNMEMVLNTNNSEIASSSIAMTAPAPANVKASVPAILAVMLNSGTKTKSFQEFFKDVNKLGMTLKFEADFQSISVNAENLAEDMPKAVDMIKEVFVAPRFNEKSLDYAKKLVKEAVLNSENTAEELAMKALFPNRPEFATSEEVLKTIDSVTLGDVVGFFEYVKNNAKAKCVFTAPLARKPELENLLVNKMSSDLGDFRKYDVNVFLYYEKLNENLLVTKVEPRNQADIVRSFKFKTNYNPKDQVVFNVLNTILGGGPSSRLFSDLREDKKLAYRVNSDMVFGGDTGVISLGIKTTTDDKIAGVQQFENIQKSLDGFDFHINKLKNSFVTQEELEAAKLRIKTKLLNSVEASTSQSQVLSSSKDTCLGINALNENLKLVDSVTVEDVRNAANYIFSTPSVISILASQDSIDFYNKNIKKS